jgi:hypothetical protein
MANFAVLGLLLLYGRSVPATMLYCGLARIYSAYDFYLYSRRVEQLAC